jgi:phosphatidylinositol glycan class S
VPKRRKGINADAVLRTINPSSRRRFLVTICFPLFVLLCLPWWWHTTSIVRLPLPKERIVALESITVRARWQG